MSSISEKSANAAHFTKFFSQIQTGGYYIWKDEGICFTKNSTGKMVASSRGDWDKIQRITPKGWAKKNVKLSNKKPCAKDEKDVKKVIDEFATPLTGDEPYEVMKARWDAMGVAGDAIAFKEHLKATAAHGYGRWGNAPTNPTHNCPKCNTDYTTIHPTKDSAKNSEPFNATSSEQWCSGICGNACWDACSEEEIISYKYINPRYTKSAEKVVIVGGGR
tara:strand:- start:1680 stop:2336 length:657 start_codon:yes stop_codon:yes gene_type:complete